MKNHLTFLLILVFNQLSLAGGSGSSTSDNYIYVAAFLLLVMIWGVPKIYTIIKSKINHPPAPTPPPIS